MTTSYYPGRQKAVERKMMQAFKPLPFTEVTQVTHFNWRKPSHFVQMFFTYRGVKLRFDYEFNLHDDMLKVEEIRKMVWADVDDVWYREKQKAQG